MKFITDALDTLEATENLRILYACESGSRAWGFASPDSDYDARLVYVRPPEWYLSIRERRDVIDRMLPNDLDLAGWDLRKALDLFAKSNASLYEWLGSPIVYGQDADFMAEWRALVPTYFSPVRVSWHYLSMAKRTAAAHLKDNTTTIKKLFYILRPLFACKWIEHEGTMPPTAFAELFRAPWVKADTMAWVDTLLAQKAEAVEGEQIRTSAPIEAWLTAAMAHAEEVNRALPGKRGTDLAPLDALFRRAVLGT